MDLNIAARLGLYAVVTMTLVPEERITASRLSRELSVSENHVAKVLRQLGKARLLRSVRGVGGGYQLAVDPAELTMLSVIECIQGPMERRCAGCEVECEAGSGCGAGQDAPVAAACGVHDVLQELTNRAYFTFKSVTIAALARRGQRKAGGEPLVLLG